jgi:ABC-type lipoprotein release transport system permease subunit
MILRLAWRSLWRNKRRTVITVCSIALGLTFAIFFIALAEGAYEQMIEQMVRIQSGHITLEHPEYRQAPSVDLWITVPPQLRSEVEKWPDVEETKLVILGQGIVKSGAGNMAAAIMGVEPSVEKASSPVARNLITGKYLEASDKSQVVVGSEMAERLKLAVGKKLVIATNDVTGTLVEELCRVKGIFRTGSEEIDAYFIQMPIDFARRLFHLPREGATQMGVILKDPGAQKRIMKRIKDRLDDRPISVLSWQEVMPDVATYIKMDKGSNLIFQAILIFLILFTIFNTLSMSVLERQREFAMLLAVGTTARRLRLQVFAETVFLGVIGCVAGLFFGGLAVVYGHVYGINLSAIMGESVNISGFALSSRMYTKFSFGIFFGSAVTVLAATLLLGLIPVRRATRISIVDTLR